MNTKDNYGFTIIEAMISMCILAIIMVIVVVFLRTGFQHWIIGESVVDAQNIAREIISGRGNWRGMEGELRELHRILNAKPEEDQFHLLKDKIRFIGPVSIVNGGDTICSTYFRPDDIQTIATGTVKYSRAILITPGTDSLLQSIPGDINGDGTLTLTERRNSDDYARGLFMTTGENAIIITDRSGVCNTHKRGDDVQIIRVGGKAGREAILITPGNNGRLESIPGDINGDGVTDIRDSNNFISSAVISYEYLPEKKAIIRKINDAPLIPHQHLGPSTIAKNVTGFTVVYYGTDSTRPIPYGTLTPTQVSSIALIEIRGTVSVMRRDVLSGITYETATFKTRIQPRALNPLYRR